MRRIVGAPCARAPLEAASEQATPSAQAESRAESDMVYGGRCRRPRWVWREFAHSLRAALVPSDSRSGLLGSDVTDGDLSKVLVRAALRQGLVPNSPQLQDYVTLCGTFARASLQARIHQSHDRDEGLP